MPELESITRPSERSTAMQTINIVTAHFILKFERAAFHRRPNQFRGGISGLRWNAALPVVPVGGNLGVQRAKCFRGILPRNRPERGVHAASRRSPGSDLKVALRALLCGSPGIQRAKCFRAIHSPNS